MKKIIIILFLFVFSLFTYKEKIESVFIEKINLNIEKEEVGVLFLPIYDSNFLLIKTKEDSILLPIYGNDNPQKILERFGEKIPTYSYTNLIEGKKEVNENKPLLLEDITITKEGKNFIISKENMNLCIFYEGSISTCDYVYFENETRIVEESMKLALYKETLSADFETELQNHWIDIYKIKKNEFTLLTLQKDTYNVVKLPNYYFHLS